MKHLITIIILFISISGITQSPDNPCGQGPQGGGQGGGGNPGSAPSPGQEFGWPRLHAVDPNEISGPLGYDSAQWVSVNDQLGYTIFYENDPDFATAPAQIVRIDLPVDPNLNIYSVRLGNFGFGMFNYDVPPNTTFYQQRLTDTEDSLNVHVDVTAGIDVVEGKVFWIFESVDPVTGLPPEDALTGFLPVNDTSINIYNDTLTKKGEGFVTFNIMPQGSLVTGDSVTAQASIIFDINAPIETNTWKNLIDAFPPTSEIDTNATVVDGNLITLFWSGEDDIGGVGVDYYDLYVAKDGEPFLLFAEQIDTTVYVFTGVQGSTYEFYTLATDYVGNVEDQKFDAEEEVTLGGQASITFTTPTAGQEFCEGDQLSIEWTAVDVDTVNILFSSDGGSNYSTIAADIASDSSPYLWTIPFTAVSDNGKLKLEQHQMNGTETESDGFIIHGIDTTELELTTCDTNAVGVVTEILTNQFGCDSVVITTTILNTEPLMAICQDITVQLDNTGVANITPEQIDNGSDMNCDVDTLELDIDQFACSDVGDIVVTLTVTDVGGNTDDCMATVTVMDTLAPTALCQNITRSLDSAGSASIATADINNNSTDACGIDSLSLDQMTFDCQSVGVNIVTLTATDVNGNSNTCTAEVTIDDDIPPVAICQDITVELDAQGQVTIAPAQVDNGSSDACGVDSLSLDQTMFDCSALGANTVTLTVIDANENSGSCTAQVTVEDDNIPLMAACQDVTVALDSQGMVTITVADVDNGSSEGCGAGMVSLDQTIFDCQSVGMNTVTLTVTGENGNSDTCTATVTVEDNIAPVALCQDTTIALNAQGSASITAAQVDNGSSDACGIDFLSLDQTAFDCQSVGSNTVTLTATDENGNNTTCTAEITVEDNSPPVAACLSLTVELDSQGMASITAMEVDGGSFDPCGIDTLTIDQMDFDCQHVGTNTVMLTATDINGNAAICTTSITIEDNISPVATCQDLTVELDAQGVTNVTAAEVDNGSSDACGIASLSLDQTAFDCQSVGTSTVTLTAMDENGNMATCTADITVEDNVPPVATCQDLTIELNTQGMASIMAAEVDNGSSDACGIASLSLDQTAFDCQSVGTSTVTLTATDENGNTATCTADITVEDNVPPVATCQDLTIELDMLGMASVTAAEVDNGSSDACGIASLSLDQTAFDCQSVGTSTVTLTATDENGNTATCTADITVEDNVPPIATCQDLTIELDAQGMASITAAEVNNGSSDACGISTLALNQTMFDCQHVGSNTITLTFTDVNNTAATCTADITVEDNVPPVTTCQDLTIELDAQGMASIMAADVDNGSDDACGIASLTLDQTAFDCQHVGSNTVTLTVTDVNGNDATCTAEITVEDNVPPVAICQDLTIELDSMGVSGITAAEIDNGSSDACGIASLILDQTAFDCQHVGANTITLTVTDVNGNSADCNSTVAVEDNIAPWIACPPDLMASCEISEQPPYLLVSKFITAGGMADDNCTIDDMGISVLNEVSDGLTCPETVTRTYQIEDVNGNASTCQHLVVINDDVPPVATCQDVTVVLDNLGMGVITPQLVDGGSTDNCGNISLGISNTDYTCADIGPRAVDLTVTDDCGNSSACSSTVYVVWSNGCPVPDFTNMGGPMISDPCTCRSNGEFDEEVYLTAPSGQGDSWVVQLTSLLDPNTFLPFPAGTPLQEVDLGNGMSQYTIVGVHLDGIGYEIFVENPTFYPGLVLDISNVCYYPKPEIVGIENPYCLNSPAFLLEGDVGGVDLDSEMFTINGMTVTEFDPSFWGIGSYQVIYTVDAGTAGSMDPGDPGCVASTTAFIDVIETPDQLACNDQVQASLDENCEAFINPDMILEGTYGCFDDYTVEISFLGSTLSNPLDISQLGKNLVVTVTHLVSGNTCWGNLTIEDKLAPVIECPTDPVQILCYEDADDVSQPFFTDNCDPNAQLIFAGEMTLDDDLCDDGTIQIVRTWLAEDQFGNQSLPCDQLIEIVLPTAVDFPNDIVWTCDQYNIYPNITDAKVLHPFVADSDPLTDKVIEVVLDPNCDNDDDDATDFNSTNIDNFGNGCPGIGLDDADVLALTGSGIPPSMASQTCQYNFTFSDQIFDECGTSFKILRTWTALDWCTNDIITTGMDGEDNLQVIKVIDNTAPTISISPFEVNANNAANHPQFCTSTDFLPPAAVTDNCNDWTLQIITPIGAAEYVNGVDGKAGGYIPDPGLNVGTHQVIYRAMDVCGNTVEDTVEVTVSDLTLPVAVCDEITSVSLTTNGQAEVEASVFDDGSYDNCCLDRFAVRKMEDHCGILENLDFGPSVILCCNDVNFNPIQLVVRVYDCADNFSECMVEVEVEDQLPPILTSCPQNQTISCDTYVQSLEPGLLVGDTTVLDAYGFPTFMNNCDGNTSYLIDVNIDNCKIGEITRSWTAVDTVGGTTSLACTQILRVEHESDWVVEFPEDLTANCGDSIPDFGQPRIFFETCELIAVSFIDIYYDVVPDACYKVARQWTVINWCVVGDEIDQELVEVPESELLLNFPDCDLDGDGDCDDRTFQDSRNQFGISDTDPDPDNFDGYITYQQVIKVNDEVDPILTCTDQTICIVDNACDVTVVLNEPEYQDCSPVVDFTATSDLPNFDADALSAENVPPGIYSATFLGTDNCNNTTACEVQLTVVDCKKPTPYCKSGLIVELMPATETIMVEAASINDGSFDNCPGDLQFSFSDDVNETEVVFGCSDLGQNDVRLWITDEAGNQAYCKTVVVVQANMVDCGNDLLQLTGVIETEMNEEVEGVDVKLTGGMDMDFITFDDGIFSFWVDKGLDYTLTPEKDTLPLNGMTTYDLVLLRKHILGVQLLDSPYKIIAADVNKSNSVTTSDMVQIRKLILGVDTIFQNNTSWRFVETAYEFPNPQNPFLEPFPEIINLNNVDADILGNDFIAVKIGDLNGSASPTNFMNAEDRSSRDTLFFNLGDQSYGIGEAIRIDFRSSNFSGIEGYQFTFNFDPESLDFIGFEQGLLPNMELGNFGLNKLERGLITTSWNGSVTTYGKEEILFSLLFETKQSTTLRRAISCSSDYTLAEAYNAGGEMLDVGFKHQGSFDVTAAGEFQLYQNRPNPFSETTVIGFQLPESQTAKLSIFDVTGKLLKEIEENYSKGYHEVSISMDELGQIGVLYYQLETETDIAVRRMVVTK
ncbi:MAG: T9SS type A sorting domain-containing protein [Bacteroidota bacterium]